MNGNEKTIFHIPSQDSYSSKQKNYKKTCKKETALMNFNNCT